jgi:hypothetical protein
MAMPRFTPKRYRRHFQDVIILKGMADALAHKDFVIFYTGPSPYVWDIAGKSVQEINGIDLLALEAHNDSEKQEAVA